MGKAYSEDLRTRMVGAVVSGKSRRAVAAQFEVAPSTVIKLQKRFEATGSVDPARQGRPKGSGKLGPFEDAIIEKVKRQSDITMPDLAAWLEARHGVIVDPSNLSKLLRRVGFTYKKNTSGIGERTLRCQAGAPGLDRTATALHAGQTRAVYLY